MAQVKKFLIDCDTGVDDSLAILYALKRPDVRVMGISTGCGNCSAAQATDNTLRIIKLANVSYEVPVAMGENKPLVGAWDGPVVSVHGDNGIGNVELPSSDQQPVSEHAVDFLIRIIHENPGELTLITLGRMTNLALAVRKDPSIVGLVKNVVFMGGSYRHSGNVQPIVEANIGGDPEAADIVLTAGFHDITMVGLDVTAETRMTQRHLDALCLAATEENRAVAEYIRKAYTYYFGFYFHQDFTLGDSPLHDPLALVIATTPQLGTYKKLPVRVETTGTYTRGMIVTDERTQPMDGGLLTICVDVDSKAAIETLLSAFCQKADTYLR